MVKFHGLFDTICGEVPKRLKGLASNTSRRVTPVRGFKSPSLRQSKTKKPLKSTKMLKSAAFSVFENVQQSSLACKNAPLLEPLCHSVSSASNSCKIQNTCRIVVQFQNHVVQQKMNEEGTFSIPLEDLSTIVCSGPNIRYGCL